MSEKALYKQNAIQNNAYCETNQISSSNRVKSYLTAEGNIDRMQKDIYCHKYCVCGMGRTWEKFSSLPAKKPQKFETATGKENF